MNVRKESPFFQEFKTPHESIPFDRIKTEDFLPALGEALRSARSRVQSIRSNTQGADFENTIVALEQCDEELSLVSETYQTLFSAHADEALQKLSPEISSQVAAFASDISLDAQLFERVKKVWDARDTLKLGTEEAQLLEKTYLAFTRNGANLPAEKQKTLRDIDQRMAVLAPKFSENALKATNTYMLEITDEKKLVGLPDAAKEAAAQVARERGKTGWVATLDMPTYIAFLKQADDRSIRRELYMANSSKCLGGAFDNSEVLKEIAKLRHERAKLLGFASHAAYVLDRRMASNAETVTSFLERLLEDSRGAAEKEIAELRAYKKKLSGDDELMPWDFAYYSEKLREEKFSIDDELLRPYFQLENVIGGVFQVAEKLYDLEFRENKSVPVYHPEVKVFEVHDKRSKEYIGLFYADFFPRATKRQGAWMTPLREQGLFQGHVRRPHVGIVCNFTKPVAGKPSLLTLQEVETLFHEFGHALHGLLSKCKYRSLAGTNVYWDFVELPSQIMENWVLEAETLKLFAKHYSTGEALPADLAKKIKDSSTFQKGYQNIRQLSFALLDMAWHSGDPSGVKDIESFEEKILSRTQILPRVKGTAIGPSFSHVFAGGYSAGYYSYKWAEVLDADAFELFKEQGVFDAVTARSFRENILEKGASEHPMILYKRFRGREPDPKALLRRDALV